MSTNIQIDVVLQKLKKISDETAAQNRSEKKEREELQELPSAPQRQTPETIKADFNAKNEFVINAARTVRESLKAGEESSAVPNLYKKKRPAAQRLGLGLCCARIDRDSSVLRISNGDPAVSIERPASSLVWQFDNSYSQFALPVDDKTSILVIYQLRRSFYAYVWSDGVINTNPDSFESRKVPGTGISFTLPDRIVPVGTPDPDNPPSPIDYIDANGIPRQVVALYVCEELSLEGDLVLQSGCGWLIPTTILFPLSAFTPWEMRITFCFVVGRNGVRELQVPDELFNGLRQALIFNDGGEYNTAEPRFGLVGEYINPLFASEGISRYGMRSGQAAVHTTPAIYTALSGEITNWSDPRLADFSYLRQTYYQNAPRVYLDRKFPRVKGRFAEWKKTRQLPANAAALIPPEAFSADRSYDVRTLGEGEEIPNDNYDYSFPPDGRRYNFAWDWGKPSFCREQLLALGFTAADLTP